MKNNYLYQGSFAELDEDIGWTDFALRNYDAQIGRWVQQDPYQEYATPYVYVGNDPINLIDPSGGSVIDPVFKTLETVVVTASRTATTLAPKIVSNITAKIIATTLMKVVSIINTAINTAPVGDRSLIYARGMGDAMFNANVLNLHDAFWGTNLSDYDDPYDKEAYLKGRLAGDALVIAQAAVQIDTGIGGGLSASLATGGTSIVVGAGVAAHGAAAAAVATSDIAWATKKLLQLNVSKVGTVGSDIGNNFQQVNTSNNSGNSSGSNVASTKQLAKEQGLPTEGKIRYVPSRGSVMNRQLTRKDGGFVDKFGNVWKKGPSRTKGEAFEWDVQLSRRGKEMLGWLSRNKKHINVSLKGIVTH